MCKMGVKVVSGECDSDNKCQLSNCDFCGNANGVEECEKCQ